MHSPSDTLRISLLQTDIFWNAPRRNLHHIGQLLNTLKGNTDLAILPETCTTGFTMNPEAVAETDDGETVRTLKAYAATNGMAIAGSFAHRDRDAARFHNRAFWIDPEGAYLHSDKHHLFSIGGEARAYSPGHSVPIFHFKGWNIALFVCYDLRFPVWSRNVGLRYDLALYVANWPEPRIAVWDTLLTARALENQAYVCGVNRIGTDGNGLRYNGHSALISPRGERQLFLSAPRETVETASIDLHALRRFREKFPVWKDADRFQIIPPQNP